MKRIAREYSKDGVGKPTLSDAALAALLEHGEFEVLSDEENTEREAELKRNWAPVD